MKNLNVITLSGRVVRPLELKTIGEKQLQVVNFTMAVNRGKDANGNETCDFIPVKAFGHTAKYLADYLKDKGRVIVSGSLRADVAKKDDGSSVTYYSVVVDDVEIVDFKEKGNAPTTAGVTSTTPVIEIAENDLPF